MASCSASPSMTQPSSMGETSSPHRRRRLPRRPGIRVWFPTTFWLRSTRARWPLTRSESPALQMRLRNASSLGSLKPMSVTVLSG
jgi:hypothetical protein